MNENLTARQQEVLQLIRDFIEEHKMPPTRAEIADILGFRSPNAAEDHLRALERKGVIEIFPGASRGITLVQDQAGLPVVGRVAAGSPILAEENIETHYELDGQLFHPKPDYLLVVKGMSMRDAGILEGDLLAVHKTHSVRSGQVVVARMGSDVTVKRLKRKERHLWLMPENPRFKPIKVDMKRDEIQIEGLVVGVIRQGAL